MFWKMCEVSTKGAIPTHWAPSWPMQVSPTMSPNPSESISSVIV